MFEMKNFLRVVACVAVLAAVVVSIGNTTSIGAEKPKPTTTKKAEK
jgi:hypothetical protein